MRKKVGSRRGSGGKLIAFYLILALATAAVVAWGIAAGSDTDPATPIAGGYDVADGADCLGPRFDVKQSGEFVNFENEEGTLGGSLRLEGKELTGDVSCTEGAGAELDARVEGKLLAGTLDGEPLEATFVREPADLGTRRAIVPSAIDGEYQATPATDCFGGRFELESHGDELELIGQGARGEIAYHDGEIEGEVACAGDAGTATVTGRAADRKLDLVVDSPAGEQRVTANKLREFGRTLAAFFIAVAIVMVAARLVGAVAVRVGQARVMGEVVAGILLGPTVFGLLAPALQAEVFPSDIIPFIGVAANLGLIFYMFLVGLELDPAQLKGRIGQAAAISNASVAIPMALGIAVAVPIYAVVGPDTKFVAFALFMGVAMSITAFPVLARILVERRMLQRPVGALSLACAAIDDVTAWFLIALATAVAVAGGAGEVVRTIALALIFCLVMAFLARPLLGRVSRAYDEAGRVPGTWIVIIFAGILLSAYTTEVIGIALIFGAFVMGMIMPRRAELTEDVTHRIEDFVVTLLLPLFFAYTGLRINVGLLDRPELWLLTLVLIAVAILGKWGGAMLAARVTGNGWRESSVIGVLMNTRGLTELIVLNLALEKGVISEALFASLVIMALVTTFMAVPILKLLDPRNELGAPVEEELEVARELSMAAFPTVLPPEHSILLAPQSEGALRQLLLLGQPLARSEPPRELILARLLRPPRGVEVRGGLQTENRLLERASDEVNGARDTLVAEGVAARSVAFISAAPGQDLTRLARTEEVDLVLLDGRRPLLGEGVPRGDVGEVLRTAPCDVGVLVAREGATVLPGPGAPVLVPFGGLEHDWAALELGAWIASATKAPLSLLGAVADENGNGAASSERISRLLGDASLLVQQFAGITAEPVVAERGHEGVLEAAAQAGLLVVGLSDRWRQEGLGATRSDIARAAPAPVLFVRRGTRPGALAPREDVTRFAWSTAGMGPHGLS